MEVRNSSEPKTLPSVATTSRELGPDVSPYVELTFLGGLGEIGRNCMFLESNGEIIVIDSGIMFPDLRMLGIDIAVSNLAALLPRANDIAAVFLTHGHEDHVGALRYLLSEIEAPIYGSELTLELAKKRVPMSRLAPGTEFIVVDDYDEVNAGPFSVRFLPVAHSVPDGHALAIDSPAGLILHSGDFKLDPTPIDGRMLDLDVIRDLAGESGVRLLLLDATNAEERGHVASESTIGPELQRQFEGSPSRRVIVTCFASHLHRIQQILDAAVGVGRKVHLVGRSIERNVVIGQRLGILEVHEDLLVDARTAASLEDADLCVICTGSQGEPRSALALMSQGRHKSIDVGPNDLVILSSEAIPGNEVGVAKVIDDLNRRGARVIHQTTHPVHASGHGHQDELVTLIQAARPQAVIPIHGEFRHLSATGDLAREAIDPPPQIVLCEDGDRIELLPFGLRLVDRVVAGDVYVTPGEIGEVEEETLRVRQELMSRGVLSVAISEPDSAGAPWYVHSLKQHGWVSDDQFREIATEITQFFGVRLETANPTSSIGELEDFVVRHLGRHLTDRFGSRPFIIAKVIRGRPH